MWIWGGWCWLKYLCKTFSDTKQCYANHCTFLKYILIKLQETNKTRKTEISSARSPRPTPTASHFCGERKWHVLRRRRWISLLSVAGRETIQRERGASVDWITSKMFTEEISLCTTEGKHQRIHYRRLIKYKYTPSHFNVDISKPAALLYKNTKGKIRDWWCGQQILC